MAYLTIVHDVYIAQIIKLIVHVLLRDIYQTATISVIFPLHNRVVFLFLFTTVDQYFLNMKSFQ